MSSETEKSTIPIICEPIPEDSFVSSTNSQFEVGTTEENFPEPGPKEPHEDFLYELLGPEAAEDVLHPKIVASTSHGFVSMSESGVLGDISSSKQRNQHGGRPRCLNERERRQRFRAGKMGGAVGLWRNLRERSWSQVVQKTTAKEDPEVQLRYNAVAREVLRHQETTLLSKLPPARSFINDESITELADLMRSSRVATVQNRRRKKQLMFQLAEAQVDQFAIMTLNNPIPGITDSQLDQSISRYIPSWRDNDPTARSTRNQYSPSSVRSGFIDSEGHPDNGEYCKKPSTNEIRVSESIDNENNLNERPLTPELQRQMSTRQAIDNLGLSLDVSLLRKRPTKPSHLCQRLHFLTKNEPRPEGQFTNRFKAEFSANNDPLTLIGDKAARDFKFDQQRAVTGRADIERNYGLQEQDKSKTVAFSHPPGSQSAPSRLELRPRKLWEPLSLAALVEYKDTRELKEPLTREFHYGRPTMWHTAIPEVNV